MLWEEYVNNFANGENPTYASISFVFPDIERKQPSFFTRLNSFLISEFSLMEQDKAIIYYPDSDDFVLSVVFYKLINGILSGDILSARSNVSQLDVGDKFRIGDAVVLCKGRDVYDGTEYIHFGPSKDSRSWGLPVSKMPNVEIAPNSATVSSYKKIESEYTRLFKQGVYQADIVTLADKIKKGRTGQSGTILVVSRDSKFSKSIENFTVEGQSIAELISIYRAKYDGELVPVGKSAFAPQIIIAPTLASAYIAGTGSNKVSEIYIDASSLRNLNESESDIVGLIEDINAPVYFFVPRSSSLDLSLLSNRGFDQFRWTPNMLTEDVMACSDISCHAYLDAIRHQRILPYFVQNERLTRIFNDLKTIESELDSDALQVTDSIALLFKYVFLLARQVCEFTPEEKASLIRKGNQVISEMMVPSCFHFLKDQKRAAKLSNIWESIREQMNDAHPLKEVAICCDLLLKPELASKKVLLVVPNDFNEDAVRHSLMSILSGSQQNISLSILNYDGFINNQKMFDYVLICGWLGKERMKRIIFSGSAANFIPILYNFEWSWLRLALNHWNSECCISLISHFIPEIQEPKQDELKIDYSWFQKPAEKEVDDDDFDDLLQKTQKMQWHGFSDIRPDDAVVDGRLISFSDGSFGVFTEGFSFTRIPSDENQSLASVSASDLNIGDIVIFGGSDHNLLISESAKLLASEGHEDSLTIASSWRDAIRSAQNSGMSDNAIIKEMQKNGIIRSDAIFRQWLDSESSIVCPRNKEDLERISLALNDELLFEMADEIVEHAKIVYSARIRTGKFLMKKLMENLDVASAISKLHSSNEFTSESFVIDVAGIGKVQIVSIVETGQIEKFPQRIINQRKVF